MDNKTSERGLPGQPRILQGFPASRRVLGERRRQQRHLLPLRQPREHHRQELLRANIFDQRSDPSYGTGAIVRHVEVDPMPKAGGQWNTFEITAQGRDITVVLNGEETAKLRSQLFEEGPVALQHGAGTIKFRKVAIKPL